jgi:hypothetical protein
MSNGHVEAFVRDSQSYLLEKATQYRGSRYLEKAAPESLDIREWNLKANIWTTDGDGRVSGITSPVRREFFHTKIVELEAERKIRSGSRVESRFDEAAIINEASRDYTPINLRRRLYLGSRARYLRACTFGGGIGGDLYL